MNPYGLLAPRDPAPATAPAAAAAPTGAHRVQYGAGPGRCQPLRFVAPPGFWPKGDGGGGGPRVPRRSGEPSRWSPCPAWRTDYWNAPTSDRQHAQQRILAALLAFVLAAALTHMGW